jgi:HEAT repeat protein
VQDFAIKDAIKYGLWQLEDDIVSKLQSPSVLVRGSAVEFLGDCYRGHRIEASFLYPMLADRKWIVRVEAIESLVRIKDRAGLPLIAERLQDPEPVARSYAAWALAEMRARRYVEHIEQARRIERSEHALSGYAMALFRFGRQELFSDILGFLKSADYLTRCATAHGIADDLKLNLEQRATAIAAVEYAALHRLYRGDGSTMETVLRQLRARQSRAGRASESPKS